jgi:Tfp pilus assembly protein PilF
LRSNEDDQALADFEKALSIAPGDIEANTYLGMLREKKGDKIAARAAFQKALATQANFGDAKKAQQAALDRLMALEGQ